jgi:DNA segregation ATPase FtsK/SpoIIIE, S-DNA-T family
LTERVLWPTAFFTTPTSTPTDARTGDEGEPLELPPPWDPPSRPAVPVLASIVPVVGAVVLWLVTGSVLALWLAALGPLIAGATMLDGYRGTRRDRTRADAKALAARERIGREVGERQSAERARR